MKGDARAEGKSRRSVPRAELPLPTLLSMALVAFTLEFDDEAEQRIPHWTTESRAAGKAKTGTWLVSMAMWTNLMQFLPGGGVTGGGATVKDLEKAAGGRLPLAGMQRWGYVTVMTSDGKRMKATGQARQDWVVAPTARGKYAQEIWRPLAAAIEERWCGRFGAEAIARLREALAAVVEKVPAEVPEHMPILGYALYSERLLEIGKQIGTVNAKGGGQTGVTAIAAMGLAALLAKVLLEFTIDFERGTNPAGRLEPSLAICANVLRLFGPESDAEGVAIREMPRLAGVSKEAIETAMSFLEKRGYVIVRTENNARLARLTAQGVLAQDGYRLRMERVHAQWRKQFGETTMLALRVALESLTIGQQGEPSPLLRGFTLHAGSWRAALPKPETLPHYPLVLHRGGFPDGS